MCQACVVTFNQHNARMTCACSDCAKHRSHLYGKPKEKYPDSGRKRKVATINMCERCGSMATSTAMGVIQSWDAPGRPSSDPVELCPGCVGDLHAFMAGQTVGVGDRPKQGYRKPWEEPKSDLSGISTEDLAKALLTRQLESGNGQ